MTGHSELLLPSLFLILQMSRTSSGHRCLLVQQLLLVSITKQNLPGHICLMPNTNNWQTRFKNQIVYISSLKAQDLDGTPTTTNDENIYVLVDWHVQYFEQFPPA